ncbi:MULTISPECIES: ComEA family DNA-binding protein [Paraburkholderia]|uniref:Competence protein ComEA n=1 Tax=Paraburkholderia tropica TaxID=92647 RepID=A0AAQ1GG90_9BURK|nr:MULTISPECIES: helix-hairpin-helix domain-containing protein [Paraburkholderia]QNB11939.1 helix-hairpin-helix domain-containing protein [Paraburkholderia tropica]RQM49929.1 helix-hairpin-helix domain-containing protein [Paraburkholderia bannensis]RQN40940.1 helix-hairpin-helix domain-containing protein [Paraburkholderia tropica]SEJ76734.1 competence protein ComEA [Paraburkholderia tropica]
MFKKLLAAVALVAAFGQAFAAVDVNTANEDALRGIKGIGPARAKAILDERGAHGPFKDASDLGKRVKGLGGHTVERLQAEGLSVGPASGQAAVAAQGAKGAQNAPNAQGKTAAPQPATVAVKK